MHILLLFLSSNKYYSCRIVKFYNVHVLGNFPAKKDPSGQEFKSDHSQDGLSKVCNPILAFTL